MSNPRLVLLDEASLGLAPVVVKRLYAALPDIIGGGTTVLIVEQDIGQALARGRPGRVPAGGPGVAHRHARRARP